MRSTQTTARKRYICTDCRKTFQGTHRGILAQLPAAFQNALEPHLLSLKSGLDRLSCEIFEFNFAHGIGPEGASKLVREVNAKEYERAREDYFSAILFRFHQHALHDKQPHQMPDFPPFDHPDSEHLPLPSASYIRDMLLRLVNRQRMSLDQAVSLLEGTFLKGDGSFKIILHAIAGYLAMCYTIVNQFGEIRAQYLTLSKSLEHIRPGLEMLQASLRARGHPAVELLWIDDITHEARFFESEIPSLTKHVEHIPPPNTSGLPLATLPPSFLTIIENSFERIEQRSKELRLLLKKDDASAVGFDMEWSPGEDGGAPGRTALLQLSTLSRCFLFQLSRLEQHLPPALISLLEDTSVKLIGRNIANDATKLRDDFNVNADGLLDLLPFCRDRNILGSDQKNATLQHLAGLALGLHLEKPDNIRRGDWDEDLGDQQREYAAMDAYIALAVYTKVLEKKAYNICLGFDEHPDGTLVSVRQAKERVKAISYLIHHDGPSIHPLEPPPTSPTDDDSSSSDSSSNTPSPPLRTLKPFTLNPKGQPTYRVVRIERVDVPSYKLKGYRRSLAGLQPSDLPFDVVVDSTKLFSRPPLEDPDALPPPDSAAAHELTSSLARPTSDVPAALEAEADEIASRQRVHEGLHGDGEPGGEGETIISVDSTAYSPDPVAYDMDIDGVDPVPLATRILADVIHALFFRIDVTKNHPGAIPYTRGLQGIVYSLDQDDARKTARKNEASVLDLIKRGYVSDPEGFDMYYLRGVDSNGLNVYGCHRGTAEGPHAKMIAWMSAFNADPELVDGYLALLRERHNKNVGHPIRFGTKWLLHYDLNLLDRVDNLHQEVYGTPGYLNYTNGTHYEQTTEKFGVIPLPQSVKQAYNIESLPLWRDFAARFNTDANDLRPPFSIAYKLPNQLATYWKSCKASKARQGLLADNAKALRSLGKLKQSTRLGAPPRRNSDDKIPDQGLAGLSLAPAQVVTAVPRPGAKKTLSSTSLASRNAGVRGPPIAARTRKKRVCKSKY
ncbi:hypothetical protein RQP46_007885 [Phenoliferia psychrophenolica]